MWLNLLEVVDADDEVRPEAVLGAFPYKFLTRALVELQADPRDVLHVCSGCLSRTDVRGGVRIDIRQAALPDARADGRALPFQDGSFGAVLIDPPYTEDWARSLYNTDYPRPSHLLTEACRVVRPGGRVGILHFIVPSPPRGRGIHLVKVIGVTTGCDFQIRAFTVYQKPLDQQSLDL